MVIKSIRYLSKGRLQKEAEHYLDGFHSGFVDTGEMSVNPGELPARRRRSAMGYSYYKKKENSQSSDPAAELG